MSRKQISPLLRTLCAVLGLVVAEAVLPVALTYPFAAHEGKLFMKARAQHLEEDKARVTEVFKAHDKTRSRPQSRSAVTAQTDEYRLALATAARAMKTDMGALSLQDELIDYLADHPEDKELQALGVSMVDRALAYNKETFTPIYGRLDRIDSIFRLSFPVWLYRNELLETKMRIRTTVPTELVAMKEGLLHPKEFLAEEHKKYEALRAMTVPPVPTGTR